MKRYILLKFWVLIFICGFSQLVSAKSIQLDEIILLQKFAINQNSNNQINYNIVPVQIKENYELSNLLAYNTTSLFSYGKSTLLIGSSVIEPVTEFRQSKAHSYTNRAKHFFVLNDRLLLEVNDS